MNGRANCILEICCAPGSTAQRAALTEEILAAGVLEAAPSEARAANPDRARDAAALAAWICRTFDLAPKGSLVAFKQEVARLAREPRG